MTLEAVPPCDGSHRADRLGRRLALAKKAFTTRHVRFADARRLVRSGVRPKPGDIVLARVVSVGQHGRLENVHGRRGTLYPGDEIVVAFGNRYAPDQFEAYVPEQLGACDLVAGGGVAAVSTARHAAMKAPTRLETIGLLAQENGTPLNLRSYAPARMRRSARPARVIAVVGSSMNAGKTTTAAGLVRGLTLAGFRVGAAKVTGTGSGGDLWTMLDAGARVARDFTDAGHASTFCLEEGELAACADALLGTLAEQGVDVAVVEIADGLLQKETAALIRIAAGRGWFDTVVFAAADAMGAAFGTDWLARHGIAPAAISGLVSASPLASQEAAGATGAPVVRLSDLRDPVAVTKLIFSAGDSVREAA